MSFNLSLEKTLKISKDLLFIIPGLLAALVLFSQAIGLPLEGLLNPFFIPMASSTAALIFFLSVALYLRGKFSQHTLVTLLAFLTAAGTVLISLWVLGAFLLNFEKVIGEWSAFSVSKNISESLPPFRRMSPLSAVSLLILAPAFLLLFPPLAGKRRNRQIAAFLAFSIFILCLFFLFNYGVDVPLVFSNQALPISILTTFSLMLLGLGIIVTAGVDVWPMSWIGAEHTNLRYLLSLPFFKNPLVIFAFLFFAIVGAGLYYLRYQKAEFRRAAQQELSAVVKLKSNQIERWYKERLGDVRFILEAREITRSAQAFLDHPDSVAAKIQVRALMESMKRNLNYFRVLLIDSKGQARLSVPGDQDWIGPLAKSHIKQVLQTSAILVSDLHSSPIVTDYQNIDLFVPLLRESSSSEKGTAPLGVWMFELLPRDFLYPAIRIWPTASPTAETLLIQKEGQEAVIWNELRHRSKTALPLRIPLKGNPNRPEVLAVKGREGLVEGRDYRGVTVFAALGKIPGTPWFIVAKVDRSEIYYPLRRQTQTAAL
ncbi:MAG: hypothetical protein AB1585_17385, partial [Thermodesulfobacteriota bacterium]